MNSAGQAGTGWIWEVVNIVPIRGHRVTDGTVVPEHEAPPRAAPQLTYRGGPLIARVKVFALYWGSAWGSVTPSAAAGTRVNRQTLDAYLADLVSGTYMDLLSEYSVAGASIQRGTFLGSAVIAPDPGSQVDDADVRAQIQQRLAAGQLPPWDANTLYAVLLPSGTAVRQAGAASCQTFCGYHDAIMSSDGTPLAYYAVLPYPDCPGCAQTADGGTLAPFDALTAVISHELAEAVTDPVPGSGWYDDQNGENGDICAWQLDTLDSYTVQKFWSNQRGTCVGPTNVR